MITSMDNNIFTGTRDSETADALFMRNFKSQKKDFNTLVNVYSKEIFTFLTLTTGSRDKALNLTRQIFVKAYYKISGINNSADFKYFLFKLMYNYSRKHSVQQKNNVEINISEDDEYFDLEGDGARIFYETIDLVKAPGALKREECLIYVLRNMEPDVRCIIIMKDILKLETAFISKLLNISEGTIRLRLATGRHHFSSAAKVIKIERRRKL